MSKNNKKTLNERTHNPFNTYKELHRNTTSNDRNPEDNVAEFAEEFSDIIERVGHANLIEV